MCEKMNYLSVILFGDILSLILLISQDIIKRVAVADY